MKANRETVNEIHLIVEAAPEDATVYLRAVEEENGELVPHDLNLVLTTADAAALGEALRAASRSKAPALFGEKARRVVLMINR